MQRTALLLTCVLAVFALAMAMADPLEGTKWKIKVVPDENANQAGEHDFDDTLTFKGSMFSSQEFAKRGFEPVQYEEDIRRFGPASFTAQAKSEKEGSTKWTGTTTANVIKGELAWTKKNGTVLNYAYQGERVDN